MVLARAEGFKLATGSVTVSRFTAENLTPANQRRMSNALDFD